MAWITLENWNLYHESLNVWLIITPNWTCIINYLWEDCQFHQFTFDKWLTDDYCLENKKRILEDKEKQLNEIIHTFSL